MVGQKGPGTKTKFYWHFGDEYNSVPPKDKNIDILANQCYFNKLKMYKEVILKY